MAYDRHPGFATSVIARMLGVLYVTVGLMKLAGMDIMEDSFQRWGHSLYFMTLVGAIELVSGVLLFEVRTRIWAAVTLWFMMIGAMYIHLQHGEPSVMVVPFFAWSFLTLLIVNRTKIYLRRRDIRF